MKKKRVKKGKYKKTNAFRCGCCANGHCSPKDKDYKSAERQAMKREDEKEVNSLFSDDFGQPTKIYVSPKTYEQLLEMFENPPEPTAAFKKAVKRYKEMFDEKQEES